MFHVLFILDAIYQILWYLSLLQEAAFYTKNLIVMITWDTLMLTGLVAQLTEGWQVDIKCILGEIW